MSRSGPGPAPAEAGRGLLSVPGHDHLVQRGALCFPQKSLPRLENQIKESQQKITEELQKYGTDIPEDENEKMFFLIDVSAARHVRGGPTRWLGGGRGPGASFSLCPERGRG